MYAVINDKNVFTSTVYDELSKKILEHHTSMNERLIATDRVLTVDADGKVKETPTADELKTVVSSVPSLEELQQQITETQLAVTAVYEASIKETA